MLERTFAMIKPDVTVKGLSGEIISKIESNGFKIVGLKKAQLSQEVAKEFYIEHKERPFYGELVDFMTSAPVVVMALEKDNAIVDWRELMGATDSAKAAEGTIRNLFGNKENIAENASHGSDSKDAAKREIQFFFSNSELL